MSLGSRLSSLLRIASRSPAVRRTARDLGRAAVRAVSDSRRSSGRSSRSGGAEAGSRRSSGDLRTDSGALILADRAGRAPLQIDYAPREDSRADPGEIVWAWVPFEEDPSQGKDRPVLVLAREPASTGGSDGEGEVLVALMLTSRDRAPEGGTTTDEHGSTWVDIGTGSWDAQCRPSEVRADRLLRLDPEAVRREGGKLDRSRFDRVAEAVRSTHGLD